MCRQMCFYALNEDALMENNSLFGPTLSEQLKELCQEAPRAKRRKQQITTDT